MPPKPRLHNDKGKMKMIPKLSPVQISNASTSSNDPSNEISSINATEAERQFEVELLWCIQQLQISLESGKLNPKQAQDTTKLLNKLMNNSVPIVQKRQIMRVTFGDYRAKMAEEDKKYSRANRQIKLVPVKANPKSVFVKKSLATTSDNNFRFNFDVVTEDNPIPDLSNVKLEDDKGNSTVYRYEKSDNTFRFNFESDE